MASTVIENIGLLATPIGKSARSGREQGEIRLLQNAYLCYEDGVITTVGTSKAPSADQRIDAHGKLVTPGGAVEICHILGKDETLRRLRASLDKLEA